jgi:catechol 2,3-dioxygenase-like lactoylglutathione lyase family enzyme
MLHHISIGITQIERAVAFYDTALRPIGYVRVWSDLRAGKEGQAVGYGPPGGEDMFALKQVSSLGEDSMLGLHVAFAATSRQAVVEFHAAALLAGGTDNGPPGLREHYGPSYFAAFVIDPEGYRLEAVCKGVA